MRITWCSPGASLKRPVVLAVIALARPGLIGFALAFCILAPGTSHSACGDTVVDVGEDCDDGGLCIQGASAGTSCSGDGGCAGGSCVTFGGDGCAANCTSETVIPFSFLPTSSTGTAYAQYSSFPITLAYVVAADGALVIGAERDGTIPVVIKDTFAFDATDLEIVCTCIRPIARRTCGGLASAAECTAGYTDGDSVCTGSDPCAFVHGPGNAATGSITCTGPSEDDVTITQDSGPPDPPVITFGGSGGAGAAALWLSAAQATTTSCSSGDMLSGYGADGLLCTDDDLQFARGTIATWPLVTGQSTGEVTNAGGGTQTLGPYMVTGAPFDCSLLATGSAEGASLSAATTLLDQYLDSDSVTASQLVFTAACGDGLIRAAEECDDGNTDTGDGCDRVCELEQCHSCVGEPSACTPLDGTPCDVALECYAGTCDMGTCIPAYAEGLPCDDGDQCTTADTCSGGSCLGTLDLAAACDDDNGCTTGDVCRDTGACLGDSDDGAPCDDGNLCTTDDACLMSDCQGTPDDGVPCDDAVECTINDTCSAGSCTGTADVGAPCQDGNQCTVNDSCSSEAECVAGGRRICNGPGQSPCTHQCYPFGGCLQEYGPKFPCTAGPKSSLQILVKDSSDGDKFLWKWASSSFDSLGMDQLSDPTTTTDYQLCAYVPGSFFSYDANSLVLDLLVPGGACGSGDCWSEKPGKGFLFKDSSAANDGITGLKLLNSASGTRIQMRGRSAALGLPSLPLPDSGMTVQLYNHDTGACAESDFDAENVRLNSGDKGKFNAKLP